MSKLCEYDPTGRFSGLAELYAQFRPDYPQEALDHLIRRCGLGSGSWVIDVGSGTGIFSRLLARRGIPVLGLEPNDAMRKQAEGDPVPAGFPSPEYRSGRAEDTGLSQACADAVVSAQAFHWFDAEPALREFHRILKPRGWVGLIWNERDESDPFTAAYSEVVRTAPEASLMEGTRARAGEVLLTHALFQDTSLDVFSHRQEANEEQLIGRALSVSYAPNEPAAREKFVADLRQVFARFQKEGKVVLRYRTSLFSAKKVCK